VWAQISVKNGLVNSFKAEESNDLQSSASNKQMKGFTVTRITEGCPIDQVKQLKMASFTQKREKITLQGVKNYKVLQNLKNSFVGRSSQTPPFKNQSPN